MSWTQLFDEINEAQQQGHKVKPVLLGPLSYLYLGKEVEEGFDRLSLLPRLLTAYQVIFAKFEKLGIEWVQVDEPILALELDKVWLDSFKLAYQVIRSDVKVLLATYFDSVVDSLDKITELDVDGLHIDIAAAPAQLDSVVERLPSDWVLSTGIINGRNVWRANLHSALQTLKPIKEQLGERLWVASSCSLLHSPVNVEHELSFQKALKTGSRLRSKKYRKCRG